jgi:hypothetical protein
VKSKTMASCFFLRTALANPSGMFQLGSGVGVSGLSDVNSSWPMPRIFAEALLLLSEFGPVGSDLHVSKPSPSIGFGALLLPPRASWFLTLLNTSLKPGGTRRLIAGVRV